MEGNFEWFLQHYNEIYSLCGKCHVVIQDKRIIKIFSTKLEAYNWVVDNNLLGDVNIQYCNGDESGYTSLNYTMLTIEE